MQNQKITKEYQSAMRTLRSISGKDVPKFLGKNIFKKKINKQTVFHKQNLFILFFISFYLHFKLKNTRNKYLTPKNKE